MKNKIIFSLGIVALFGLKTFSQTPTLITLVPENIKSCSERIKKVSYFWKLDSLGGNGFRLYAYKDLLQSDINKIQKSVLLEPVL